MGITFSDPDVDTDQDIVQIAALTPTDNAVIIGNGTAWVAESGATLKTSLGLTIGTDVQAYDADLASWAAVTRASGFDTFAGTPTSANLRALLSDESGSGALLFASGALGTPASGVLTNCTGLPNASVVGLGTAALVADNTLVHLAGSETITGTKTFGAGSAAVRVLLNGSNGTESAFQHQEAGSNRWLVGKGPNTGGDDYEFYNYNASAVDFSLGYLTGLPYFRVTPQVAGDPVMTRGATETVTGAKIFSANIGVGVADQNLIANRVNGLNLRATGEIALRTANPCSLGLSTSSGQHFYFYTDNGSAFVLNGNISSSGGTTSYNTTSDEFLKDHINDAAYDPDWIMSLRIREFEFKAFPGIKYTGFIAQELAETESSAVTPRYGSPGEDDFRPASVDPSKLIYKMALEMQRMRSRLAALEASQ